MAILSIILSNNPENYELVHFFVVVVPTLMWYFLIYVYEDVNTRKWFNITLSVLRYSLTEFQNNFSCQHDWQIEQDGIREKFEAVSIHILNDAFPTITIVDAKGKFI